MLSTAFAMAGVVALVTTCLAGSTFLHDRGTARPVIRALAAMVGGIAFLLSVITLDAHTATALAALVTAAVVVMRVRFTSSLRGLRGAVPSQAWAEVTYALAGTLSLLVGWVLLDDRWLAFTAIGFMAWGDAAAGLARAEVSRLLSYAGPTLVMLAVSAVVVSIFEPGWIGLVGALVATASEGRTPKLLSVRDDNLIVVASSVAVMAICRLASGA
jgi:hypothetical protein